MVQCTTLRYTEDLMAVTLANDDLRGFITRWDAVIAGMTPSLTWCGSKFTFTTPSRTSSLSLMIWQCTIAHRRGNPTALMIFSWKLHGITSRGSVLKRCDRPQRSQFQVRETPPQHPTDHRLLANLRAFATTFRLASAPEERIAVINMRNLTKEKAEVRKVSLGPSQEALVVLCLPGSRNQVCKFWKAGKCQRGNDCAFQHPPKPAAPSTKDDKRGKSQKKKKKNKKKGDRSRSSSRGSNSSRGSQSLRDKGGKPCSPGSAAVCLMRALVLVAVVNLRPVLIACRRASPPAYFTTSILPCQLHPIALFHLWTTLKSTKFPPSMIAIWIHAMPNTELTIQFASQRAIVLVKIRSKHGHTCSTDVAVSCLSGVASKTLQVQLCMWQWYRLSPLHPFRPECPARTHAVPAA